MTAPDADHRAFVETYLRCRLEDAVLDAEDGPGLFDAQIEAVRALGVLSDVLADTLSDDAARAFAVRHVDFDDDEDRDEPAPRVVVCPTAIRQDWGTFVVTHVLVSRNSVEIGAQGTVERIDALPPSRHGSHRMGHPDEVEIDIGTGPQTAHFSGGGGQNSFEGQFGVHGTISPDITEITVLGERIALPAGTPREMHVDDLTHLSVSERAARYLDLINRAERHWHGFDRRAAVRQVFDDLGLPVGDADDGNDETRPGVRHRGPRRPQRGGRTSADRQRWVALAAKGHADGMHITLTTLSIAARTATLSYVVTAATGTRTDLWTRPLVISATDERGRAYTTATAEGSGGGRELRGSVHLDPLPPADAMVLTIAVDTCAHRLTVDVPLDATTLP